MKRSARNTLRSTLLLLAGAVCSGTAADAIPPDEAWVARFSGPGAAMDSANAVAVDNAGNVYVTGQTQASSSGSFSDFVTIKYDASGVQQWVRYYNGPGDSIDVATAIVVDVSQNITVTGYSRGAGSIDEDYATIKYDPAGNVLWVTRYNGPGNAQDEPFAVAADGEGSIYVTGRSNRTGGWFEGHDYLTIKYDSDGNEEWVARHNSTGNDWDEAHDIVLDNAANVYVTGTHAFDAGTAYHDYATIKYDGEGVQQWIAEDDGTGSNWDAAVALALDTAGNVYVTGYTSGSGTVYDYTTIKYDESGSFVWSAVYSSTGLGSGVSADIPSGLVVDGSGNVYVTGVSALDFATVKYDANGVEQWVRRHGTAQQDDRAMAIGIDAAGDVYVTGSAAGSIVTIKYDAGGSVAWQMTNTATGSGADWGTAIALDPIGNIYVAGRSSWPGTGYDLTTIKYSQSPVGVVPAERAAGFKLLGNHPNPFQGATTIDFELPAGTKGPVRLRVFDASGRAIETLVDAPLSAGPHSVHWRALGVSSGTYYYKLEAAGNTVTRKMLLVR